MSQARRNVLTAMSLALAVYSQGLFAFEFTSNDKFSAVGEWRIHHESGRVSICEHPAINFTGQFKAAPKCSPWTKSLGKGSFRLVKYLSENSGVFVVDAKSGRMAYCTFGYTPDGTPICSPLSKD